MLADAETRLASGHLSSAAATAREVYEQTGDWRARALSARVAMASRQAIRALGLAGMAAPGSGEAAATAGSTSSAETASGRELTGLAMGAVMEFGRAFGALDLAQVMWYSEGDLEAAARCYAHSAVLQMRDVGNIKVAEHHLLAAEELEIADGSDGWLQRSLVRAELLARQGKHHEAAQQVRATLDRLRDLNAPPRRLIRAAVEGLASGSPDQQAGLLDLMVAQLGLVSPPSARVVLLRELGRVGELGAGARERLPQLRRLLQISSDKQLCATDRALLTMTLAELDRLAGKRSAARTKLITAGARLRKPGMRLYLREWSLAVDRLGPRTSVTEPGLLGDQGVRGRIPGLSRAVRGLPGGAGRGAADGEREAGRAADRAGRGAARPVAGSGDPVARPRLPGQGVPGAVERGNLGLEPVPEPGRGGLHAARRLHPGEGVARDGRRQGPGRAGGIAGQGARCPCPRERGTDRLHLGPAGRASSPASTGRSRPSSASSAGTAPATPGC